MANCPDQNCRDSKLNKTTFFSIVAVLIMVCGGAGGIFVQSMASNQEKLGKEFREHLKDYNQLKTNQELILQRQRDTQETLKDMKEDQRRRDKIIIKKLDDIKDNSQ